MFFSLSTTPCPNSVRPKGRKTDIRAHLRALAPANPEQDAIRGHHKNKSNSSLLNPKSLKILTNTKAMGNSLIKNTVFSIQDWSNGSAARELAEQ